MSGSAADDDGNPAGAERAGAHETAGDLLDVPRERAGESRQRLAGEVGRIVIDLGHRYLLLKGCLRLYGQA